MSDTVLNETQIKELNLRKILHKRGLIHYSYNCPKCGKSIISQDDFIHNGIKYPIYKDYSSNWGGSTWSVETVCPDCDVRIQFNDGI
jgi:predicted RNA-binding Zn-ribbon protein involved in translation (DUF1610 family)